MSRKQQTKRGMAAIYIVVFTTMLLGIVTLSFVRIMMSETDRTSKDFLSESAYNSAMAGVEDAKALLLKYYKCSGVAASNQECNKIKERFVNKNAPTGTTPYTSSEHCDLGSLSIQDSEDVREIAIQSGADNVSDQAYTCVNVRLNGNYKAELTEDKPTTVIPLRPDVNYTHAFEVKYIRLEITRPKDASQEHINWSWAAGNPDTPDGYFDISNKNNGGVLGAKGVLQDEEITEKNALDVMLIQTGDTWTSEQFYAAQSVGSVNKTNRAKVMLLPTFENTENATRTKISAKTLAYSATKQYNSPIAVQCNTVSCIADFELPYPVGDGDTPARSDDTFFLVLGTVYSAPNIKVTVTMFNGDPADNDSSEIDFFNVQPIIDSTGRAGDLMRRVETRVQFANGEALVPGAELSVTGDVKKDFYVTKNCIAGTSSCPDSGEE